MGLWTWLKCRSSQKSGAATAKSDGRDIVVHCRLTVRQKDNGEIAVFMSDSRTPGACMAIFKPNGDGWEIGEECLGRFGGNLAASAVVSVMPEASGRFKMVDDHLYGFVCGADGCHVL